MAVSENLLQDVACRLLKTSAVHLPRDVTVALEQALAGESNRTAKAQIETILKNNDVAAERNVAMCQDTGLPLYFIKLGTNVKMDGDPIKALWNASEIATREVPLRQNCIHPLTYRNSGTNTGWGIPGIHWEIVPGSDFLEITATPKGFGSEMRCSLIWVVTSENMAKATMKTVLDFVEDTMGEPCPPLIIGVGLGGTAEISMLNLKKAMYRVPFGADNEDPMVAELEREVLGAVNNTGLGPMGLGGKNYALTVNIEVAGSHTAIVPISVGVQCWAARYSSARIYNDGRVQYLTHSELGGGE